MDAPAVMTTTSHRCEMNFAEEVQEQFGFLHQHGFIISQSNHTFVRFESRQVYLNVYHGRQSFEIGLEMGSIIAGAEDTSYSMSEIIRLIEPTKADHYRNYAAQIPDAVVEGVKGLATRFRNCLDAGILKDPALFECLRKNRETWLREYSVEVALSKMRQEYEAAWHAKDYAQVAKLLGPFRSALTRTELLKLDYAKKHSPDK